MFVVAVLARRWEMVRVLVLPAAVITTALLVATIVHWDKFSVGTAPFALWLASYLLPPPCYVVAYVGTSGGRGRPPPTTPCRPGLRRLLWVLGGLLTAEAAFAFVSPSVPGRTSSPGC